MWSMIYNGLIIASGIKVGFSPLKLFYLLQYKPYKNDEKCF